MQFAQRRAAFAALLGPLVLLALAVLPAPANAYPRPGITERVSVAPDGSEGNGHSSSTAISADGRHAAFASSASNFVSDDTNICETVFGPVPCSDIFVHDRDTGAIARVSVASDGTEGNGWSWMPAMSADGRHVAFASEASNLVPGDENETWDIFVHDRETGTTERVSVASDGTEGIGVSENIDISADGRHVAFASEASNLVPGDENANWDIFVHDREAGTTERVSVASDGTEGNGNSFTGSYSDPAISADGRYVAFASFAPNLVPGDENGNRDIFVRDRETGTTERVSVVSDGTEANGHSYSPVISADGRHVAFVSLGSNLVPGDENGDGRSWDVFVHDRDTGTTERVSVASDGTEGNGSSYSQTPAISADGRHVAFASAASNLVPGDESGNSDVFVHDRDTGTTERVSVASDGTEGNGNSLPETLAISADGRHVAFASDASNLVSDDTNRCPTLFGGLVPCVDTFVRDRGPATGVGALEVQQAPGELVLSGWATFSGQKMSSASDLPDDATGLLSSGAELTGASIIYRPEQPEQEDLLVRLRLASLPGERCTVVVCERGGGAPGALAPGVLHRRVLYAVGFELEGISYKVRARSGSAVRAGSVRESDEPHFALYRCDPDCTEQAPLAGTIGTTGTEVVVSVPLSALGADEEVTLTRVRASTSREEGALEAEETLDEVDLPDASLPAHGVILGITPAGTPESGVAFDTPMDLADGSFSGSLAVSSLSPGDYEVWAKACLGHTCGVASVPVTLEDGLPPSPSPSPTGSPSPSPTESPPSEQTQLTFTGESATSGQYSDKTLFEARLTDSNGDPISDQELTFELTGSESSRAFTATTDSDGVASVTPTLKEKPGPYQLTVRYDGDDDRAPSAATTGFAVEKEDTDTKLTVEGEDDDKRVVARLSDLDSRSDGVSERTIDFYSDSELIGSAQTDSDGVATVALPPRHRGANRTYEAVFEGDDFYLASSDDRPGKGGGQGDGKGSGTTQVDRLYRWAVLFL